MSGSVHNELLARKALLKSVASKKDIITIALSGSLKIIGHKKTLMGENET